MGCSLGVSLPDVQKKSLSQDINNTYKRILNGTSPSHKNKLLSAVRSYEQKISSLDKGYDYYLLAEKTIQNLYPAKSSSIDMSEAAEELRILVDLDKAKKSALYKSSEKRNKLVQTVFDLSKKVKDH